MRRILVAGAVVYALAIGIWLLIEAPNAVHLPPGGRSVLYIGVVLVWGFVGVGSFAWLRRPDNATGKLMVIVGVLVGLTGFQFFDTPALLGLGLAVDTLSGSVLIHLLLAFPSGRVEGRWARRVVAFGYVAGFAQFPGLLFTSCDEGCNIDENPWMIADVPALSLIFGLIQAFSLLFAIVGGVIVLLYRWRTSNRSQRRGLEPVLLLGAVILALGLGLVIANISGVAPEVFQILFFGAFALVPWAFLLGLMRTRFFRTAAVGRVIERLTQDPRGVRDALAAELGDPTLEVAYWLPDSGYVDATGLPAAEPGPDQVMTQIENEGRCVGALIHDPVLCESPELLREAAAAAALAIENARLEVELRARLAALRASRARLVEAGDAERRRLGRDLHDGAQQRLVALMIELQLARERFESDPAGARELVDSAFANAQEAVGRAARPGRRDPSRRALAARARCGAGVAGQPLPGAGRVRERARGAAAERRRDRRVLRRRRGADERHQVRGRDACAGRGPARERRRRDRRPRRRRRRGGDRGRHRFERPDRPCRRARRHARGGEPAGRGHARARPVPAMTAGR